MSIESDHSKSQLERVLGQSIGEILNAILKRVVLSFAIAFLIIFAAFIVRFSRVSFVREMGTFEFAFALGCGVLLIVAVMVFEVVIFSMLLKRTRQGAEIVKLTS